MSDSPQADTEKALALATVNDFHEYFSRPVPLTDGSRYTLPGGLSIVALPAEMGGLQVETFAEMYERVSKFLAKTYESGVTGFGHKLADPEAEVWVSGNIAAVLVGWSGHMDGRGDFVHSVNICTLYRLPSESAVQANPWRLSGLFDMDHPAPGAPVPPVETGPLPEVNALFEALLAHIKTQNWEAIPPLLLPGAGATISLKSGVPDTLKWPEFLKRLQADAGSGPVTEKSLHNCESRRCGNVAFIWAPFVQTIDGREHAQGVNICSFRFDDGQWLISGLQETIFIKD